jgi:hypothetical protein
MKIIFNNAPPHDPAEREVFGAAGDWQLLAFTDRKREYFLSRGLWHVQLWHADAGVSVLTPSRLTGGCFEVYPFRGLKARARAYDALARAVRGDHGIEVPPASLIARLQRWFVDGEVRRVVPCGA